MKLYLLMVSHVDQLRRTELEQLLETLDSVELSRPMKCCGDLDEGVAETKRRRLFAHTTAISRVRNQDEITTMLEQRFGNLQA